MYTVTRRSVDIADASPGLPRCGAGMDIVTIWFLVVYFLALLPARSARRPVRRATGSPSRLGLLVAAMFVATSPCALAESSTIGALTAFAAVVLKERMTRIVFAALASGRCSTCGVPPVSPDNLAYCDIYASITPFMPGWSAADR